jgi:hypothetical protein
MPLLNVIEDDRMSFSASVVTADEWWASCNVRNVTDEEAAEIIELQKAEKRLQDLLREIESRPEVDLQSSEQAAHPEYTDPYVDHTYCSDCRECITCNLRPCRDGGAHKN